jgi:hypothetical protein
LSVLHHVHAPSGRTAGAGVLGLIVSAATMAAAGELGSIRAVVISVLAAGVVYWVADSYAEALAVHLVEQRGFMRALAEQLRQRRAVIEAAYVPLAAVVLLAAFGVDESAAVTGGLCVATGLLFVYSWVGAARSGLSGIRCLGTAVLISMLGVAMVLLKTTLHSPAH